MVNWEEFVKGMNKSAANLNMTVKIDKHISNGIKGLTVDEDGEERSFILNDCTHEDVQLVNVESGSTKCVVSSPHAAFLSTITQKNVEMYQGQSPRPQPEREQDEPMIVWSDKALDALESHLGGDWECEPFPNDSSCTRGHDNDGSVGTEIFKSGLSLGICAAKGDLKIFGVEGDVCCYFFLGKTEDEIVARILSC